MGLAGSEADHQRPVAMWRSEHRTAASDPSFWNGNRGRTARTELSAAGQLKKVDVTGGALQTVCTSPAIGGSWNQDGVIVLGSPQGGIVRCPASGGTASIVTQPNASRQESTHLLPWFLPDGLQD